MVVHDRTRLTDGLCAHHRPWPQGQGRWFMDIAWEDDSRWQYPGTAELQLGPGQLAVHAFGCSQLPMTVIRQSEGTPRSTIANPLVWRTIPRRPDSGECNPPPAGNALRHGCSGPNTPASRTPPRSSQFPILPHASLPIGRCRTSTIGRSFPMGRWARSGHAHGSASCITPAGDTDRHRDAAGLPA